MKKQSVITAMILSGAVGFVSSPAWAQKATSDKPTHQTRPGTDQNIPRGAEPGTPELSKNDIRVVEKALQAKGYKVGKIDGAADNEFRTAIRAFQKDTGLTVTGMVDQETADQLGVKISAKPSTSGMSGKSVEPTQKKPGDDQSLSPGARK